MTATADSPSGGFEQYTADVYGWAYRLLGRHHDALDVVQDVFLRWDTQCAQSVPIRPRGWLRRVTVNRAIDVRRRRHAGERPIEAVAECVVAPVDTATHADREALRGDIALALAALSEAQRGALIAKVYDELSFAEIAVEFGVAVSTAKTHYLRAVRALRDRLSPRWSEENER